MLFPFIMLTVSGQQLYMETGKVLSFFDYKNSEGNSPGDLKGSNQSSFGLGFRKSVMRSPWHLSFGLATSKYGATSSDEELGNYSEWEGTYLGPNLGVDYEFFKPVMNPVEINRYSFCLRGAVAADFLINGKQRLNDQVFDLNGVEEFDKPVFFLKGGTRFNCYITKNYVLYAQYMFGRSFLFGNYNGQEQLRYLTHNVSLGFSAILFYRR